MRNMKTLEIYIFKSLYTKVYIYIYIYMRTKSIGFFFEILWMY